MQKKIIFILLIALISFTTTKHVRAVTTSSVSASIIPSPTPISDETITENLKKRLQETLDNDATPSASSYRSFVGIIRDVIKNTLVVEDKDGKKNVMIQDNATIVRSPGNATIKAENIRIEDYLIAIGTLRESDELQAIRIIVSVNPLSTINKKTGAAKITKINKNDLVVTSLSGGETVELTLSQKTKLKTSLGESLETTELSVGDSIIYTALDSKDELTLTSLMRIGFSDDTPNASPIPSPTTN